MSLNSLNYFDIFVIIILFLSTITALSKGFIRTFTSLVSWLFSFIGSCLLYPHSQLIVNRFVVNKLVVSVISGLLSYLLSMIFISFINTKLLNVTENIRGGAIDRSLGLAFGLLRGILITCIIYTLISMAAGILNNKDDVLGSDKNNKVMFSFVSEAQSYHLIDRTTKWILSILPIEGDLKKISVGLLKDSLDSVANSNILGGNQSLGSTDQNKPNATGNNSLENGKALINELDTLQQQLHPSEGGSDNSNSSMPNISEDQVKNIMQQIATPEQPNKE